MLGDGGCWSPTFQPNLEGSEGADHEGKGEKRISLEVTASAKAWIWSVLGAFEEHQGGQWGRVEET